MSNYPNKISVPTAITDKSKLNLSGRHITTGNFMDYMISKRMRLVPKQSVKISHNLFSRLDALEVPTYGDSTIRTRAFFVPYRTIMPSWNDFIEDSVHCYANGTSSLVAYAHRIKNSQLVNLFMQTSSYQNFPAFSTSTTNLDTADIVILQSGSGGPVGYNLTPHGARALKILHQCGIALDFNLKNTEIYHSALQLLAVAKVYFDWYYQNQYISDELAMTMESFFNYDQTIDFAEWMNTGKLAILFGVITKVNYDSDYFVSAWDNPVGPTNGSMSQIYINDIDSTTKTNVIGGYDSLNQAVQIQSQVQGSTGSQRINFSQYTLDALKSLNDYCKRKQIAGARVFDRYLAEYGVTLESEALKRSVYLTDYIQPVNIGDVTSTANTEGARLGDYAGKGISDGDGSFEFTTYEHGELIIISTIIPHTSYYQGQDRSTYAQTRMDFFIPEFDSMGVQSLDTREVFMPLDSRQQYPAGTTTYNALNYNNLVFGFVPRYAEYKRGVDMITGDFRLRSRGAGNDSWTLFRDMLPTFMKNGIAGTKHDRVFTTGADSEQYNRLFYTTDDNYDHFKIEHTFFIESMFPGKKLFDEYEFRDEDKAERVSVDLQGVKAN